MGKKDLSHCRKGGREKKKKGIREGGENGKGGLKKEVSMIISDHHHKERIDGEVMKEEGTTKQRPTRIWAQVNLLRAFGSVFAR